MALKSDKSYETIVAFVDAVVTVRQAIKHYFLNRLKELHGSEITYEMFQVLVVLWRKHEVNQQEVANAVQKGKASLSPLIDKLVKIKLVTRSEDASDRRNKIITLTSAGRQYEKKFEPMMHEFYEKLQGNSGIAKIREETAFLMMISNRI